MKLAGRCAIVTGASQGLGLRVAERLLEEGASVSICAREEGALRAAERRLREVASEGRRVLAVCCDVSHPGEVDALVATTVDAFGHLDVLVNNAGVYGPLGPLEDVSWDAWVRAIEIDLYGTVYPCRAVLPHLKRRGGGKIINLSGGGATQPLPRISAYAAAKAAVVRFTETFAEEVRGDRIDVNAIAPGALATRLLDDVIAAGAERVGAEFHDRMLRVKEEGGTPLDAGADLCVWLASPASDGISGRLLSALWDPWRDLATHRDALAKSDVYTLRRIVPKDRGLDFGEPR